MNNYLWLILVSCILQMACSDSTTKNDNLYISKVKIPMETTEMIRKVDAAYASIDLENVEYVLNKQRAKSIKEKLDALEPGKEMNLLLYDFADESFRAGNIVLSISIFEDFLKFFKENDALGKEVTIAEIQRKLAICYMRKAELENCVANHNNESCIIPLSEKAQYRLTEDVSKAIEYMEEFLEKFPLDYEVQYLLNIAHMTLGQYPDKVLEQFRITDGYFENVNSLNSLMLQ